MRRISIELKIIIAVIFFTLFIVSLERYQLSKNIINQFIESKKSKNNLLVNTIAPVIALNISLGLESANNEYLAQIVAQNSDLEFIELKNSNGEVVFTHKSEHTNLESKNEQNTNTCSKDILDPISFKKSGHVDLHFSDDDFQIVLSKNRDTAIEIFFITTLLLALFVYFIKHEFKYLKELSESVLSYDPKLNNFTFTASNRLDEVGVIHNAIISMVERIHSNSQLLNETNAQLEIKVVERTEKIEKKNQKLQAEIKNKNVLLRELYHRVKNNLQIISGLLSLQSRRIKDETIKSIFDETNQRIKAMAMIHEKLYQSEDLEAVDMQVYTLELVENLRRSFHTKELTFEVACENFFLDLERAVPMGLIINELVTNAIKYAFHENDEKKIISIKMYKIPDEKFILEVYDNGKGADLQTLHEGFGFKLIESLASFQLKGVICCFNENGLHHQIKFSKGFVI
jgi:two-component sensor histidine kinase